MKLTDTKTGKSETLVPVTGWKFASKRQEEIAKSINAQYIFVRSNGQLPAWITRALQTEGLSVKQIGRTTNVSATFAAYFR